MNRARPAIQTILMLALAGALATTSAAATAGSVVVKVSGVGASVGEIGCALFGGPEHFPMDATAARQIWLHADKEGVVCAFDNVSAGRWAVSVSHDLNGNRKVDTNFFGIPIEPWGVSNNVRPTLRAPRFDEAAFEVDAGQATQVDVKVAK